MNKYILRENGIYLFWNQHHLGFLPTGSCCSSISSVIIPNLFVCTNRCFRISMLPGQNDIGALFIPPSTRVILCTLVSAGILVSVPDEERCQFVISWQLFIYPWWGLVVPGVNKNWKNDKKDKKANYNKREKSKKKEGEKKTEIQKEKDLKNISILWCQGSFALLQCFLFIFGILLGSELHPIVVGHWTSKSGFGIIETLNCQHIVVSWTNLHQHHQDNH